MLRNLRRLVAIGFGIHSDTDKRSRFSSLFNKMSLRMIYIFGDVENCDIGVGHLPFPLHLV